MKNIIAATINPITIEDMIVVVGFETPVGFPEASVVCNNIGFHVYNITYDKILTTRNHTIRLTHPLPFFSTS